LKVDNEEKFTVIGKAFHTFTTLPMKKLCRTVCVHLGLYNNLYGCPLVWDTELKVNALFTVRLLTNSWAFFCFH